jgi:hypothetical protein
MCDMRLGTEERKRLGSTEHGTRNGTRNPPLCLQTPRREAVAQLAVLRRFCGNEDFALASHGLASAGLQVGLAQQWLPRSPQH